MTKPIPFETSIQSLEEIVSQLEKGELPLEDSLKQFEKGIALVRACQEKLSQAEQRIEYISNTDTSQSASQINE